MTIRVYECDRCEKLVPSPLHIVSILKIAGYEIDSGVQAGYETRKVGWCDECYKLIEESLKRYQEHVGLSA